jgi:hypothetical protein
LFNSGIIPAFAWRDCGKLRHTLGRIAGVQAEIRSHLPNKVMNVNTRAKLISPKTKRKKNKKKKEEDDDDDDDEEKVWREDTERDYILAAELVENTLL